MSLPSGVYVPFISIHAPRVGCDAYMWTRHFRQHKFQSTHPGWGATWISSFWIPDFLFQSTHPGWGATKRCGNTTARKNYFNPRTPGGVRRSYDVTPKPTPQISIHAPRVGCDAFKGRGRMSIIISIHAPRVGCDHQRAVERRHCTGISIHAPRVGCDLTI